MKNYKFRGKRKENGKWVYGYLFKPSCFNLCYILEDKSKAVSDDENYTGAWHFPDDLMIAFEVIPETVGQYVELFDDEGIKIYEDDIVEIQDKGETKTSYISDVVITCNGVLVRPHPAHKKLGIGSYRNLSWFSDYGIGNEDKMGYVSCKIRGNKYDNTELMKQIGSEE